MLKEYLRLLALRESKVVLGHKYVNLWLLTIVLVATFVSIAFSNGSMIYLDEKMNDPFTNWVNVERSFGDDRMDEFREDLAVDTLKERFGYDDVQGDCVARYTFVSKENKTYNFDVRFFERLQSKLVSAILAEENVISGCAIPEDKLTDKSLGVIITLDMLKKLGYSRDSIPAYVDFRSSSKGADTLGLEMIEEKYAAAPLPLLGVVKRLPMNMDAVASLYLHEQYQDVKHPLNLNNESYARNLLFYVPDYLVEDFKVSVPRLAPHGMKKVEALEYETGLDYIIPWKEGKIMLVYVPDASISTASLVQLGKNILHRYAKCELKRVYQYKVVDKPLKERDYLSVSFQRLDSIRAFEHFAKENYNVEIEMSQVSSKENFNAVSVMANILSWAMIVFSMVCIIMFIVNMLQSYFQKVKRNMGTFKAFGISSSELINVYVLILLVIVISAIIISLSVTWLIQLLLPVLGLLKDGQFNYLALWNMKTVWSVIIVIVATVVTVRVVMSRLLRQTPGDLIYDR